MYISNYQLGIIWNIGSYVESEKRLVIRHKDKYFLEQLKNLTQNNIYFQSTIEKEYYALKMPEIDMKYLENLGWTDRNADIRHLPVLSDYKDFLRAYIELHSSLDYSKRNPTIRKLRFRIYGNEMLIEELNQTISNYCNVKNKTPQVAHNNKTAILYYQSFREIDNIFSYIEGKPCNPAFWKNAERKLNLPKLKNMKI